MRQALYPWSDPEESLFILVPEYKVIQLSINQSEFINYFRHKRQVHSY